MIYKTIATFKYRGHTISVREERDSTESTPWYLVYNGRKMHSRWRYRLEVDALREVLTAIQHLCDF